MRRGWKIALGVVGAVLLVNGLLLGTFFFLGHYQEKHYYEFAKPAGKIEKKYTALGSDKTSHKRIETGDKILKRYEIYYPSKMEESNASYPLVIMANGTGYPVSKYREVLSHLASWGFIVAGNEDENSRTGESSDKTLDYMLAVNEEEDSPFYQKIDVAHIGIAGHSQGGVGAINAVTKQKNGSRYAALWSASATSSYWGQDDVFGSSWSYDVSQIRIPYLMVAGTGNLAAGSATDITAREGQGICPLWSLEENYGLLPNGVPKAMGRLKGKDHGDMLRYADGYMTAWFAYWLGGDEEAKEAFFGDAPEMKNNKNWQDVRID